MFDLDLLKSGDEDELELNIDFDSKSLSMVLNILSFKRLNLFISLFFLSTFLELLKANGESDGLCIVDVKEIVLCFLKLILKSFVSVLNKFDLFLEGTLELPAFNFIFLSILLFLKLVDLLLIKDDTADSCSGE